jgi:hypothetical protein
MVVLFCSALRPLPPALALLGAVLGAGLAGPGPVLAAADCRFLEPIGGKGATPIVSQRVVSGKSPDPAGGSTAFQVDKPYSSYRFFFTATSADPKARYPVSGTLTLADGSSRKLFQETLSPPVGRGRQFGPFAALPGQRVKQVNFRIGAADRSEALGFSYRISAQGCR